MNEHGHRYSYTEPPPMRDRSFLRKKTSPRKMHEPEDSHRHNAKADAVRKAEDPEVFRESSESSQDQSRAQNPAARKCSMSSIHFSGLNNVHRRPRTIGESAPRKSEDLQQQDLAAQARGEIRVWHRLHTREACWSSTDAAENVARPALLLISCRRLRMLLPVSDSETSHSAQPLSPLRR